MHVKTVIHHMNEKESNAIERALRCARIGHGVLTTPSVLRRLWGMGYTVPDTTMLRSERWENGNG